MKLINDLNTLLKRLESINKETLSKEAVESELTEIEELLPELEKIQERFLNVAVQI